MPKSQKPSRKKKPQTARLNAQNPIMRDLLSIDTECRALLAQTSRIAPFLMSKELVLAGDVQKINDHAQILSRDMASMKDELETIRSSIPANINPSRPRDVTLGVNLGMQYQEWQDRYQRSVIPTINVLTELFAEAAKVLEEQRNEAAAESISDVASASSSTESTSSSSAE